MFLKSSIIILENEDFFKKSMISDGSMNNIEFFKIFMNMTLNYVEITFNNQDVQKLINSNEKFDLIFIDHFFNEAFMIFGHIFNAPIIFFATGGTNCLVDAFVNNPGEYSYVPFKFSGFTDEMTFTERMTNYCREMISKFFFVDKIANDQEKLLKRYFPSSPSLRELKDRVALIFTNSHLSVETPRPFAPNLIPIGGVHVKQVRELPTDIKKFLDEAKDGAIFFSLGSIFKTHYLGNETRNNLMDVFSKLPVRVLMKFEDEHNETFDNVMIGKWLPQNDILG